jgi:hypothetical protein
LGAGRIVVGGRGTSVVVVGQCIQIGDAEEILKKTSLKGCPNSQL